MLRRRKMENMDVNGVGYKVTVSGIKSNNKCNLISQSGTYAISEVTTSNQIGGNATNAKRVSREAAKPDWTKQLVYVDVGTVVSHKTFGKGTITKFDNAKKYLRVRFAVGEKNFVFPGAFVDGFLTLD